MKRTVTIGDCIVGDGTVRVIAPIMPATTSEIGALAELASAADIIEWRIDALDERSHGTVLDAAVTLRSATRTPILATFRTSAEGGLRDISPARYASLLSDLARSGTVDAIDVEWFSADGRAEIVAACHEAGLPVIGSFHDFAGTPDSDELVRHMWDMEKGGADIAKVAVMANSNADVLALLGAADKASTALSCPIIPIAMGPRGVFTRIMGGQFGSCATFASVGAESAPGQIPLADMRAALEHTEKWTAGVTGNQ